jgi:hypothetical protein
MGKVVAEDRVTLEWVDLSFLSVVAVAVNAPRRLWLHHHYYQVHKTAKE